MNASAEGQVLIVTEPSGPPADAPLRKSPEPCGAQGQGLRAGRGDRGQRLAYTTPQTDRGTGPSHSTGKEIIYFFSLTDRIHLEAPYGAK